MMMRKEDHSSTTQEGRGEEGGREMSMIVAGRKSQQKKALKI